MIFPTHVYRCPGIYVMTDGFSYTCVTAQNQAELEDLLNLGWYATLPQASQVAGARAYVKRKRADWRNLKPKRKKSDKAKKPALQAAAEPVPTPTPSAVPADSAEPTRAELEQKATELGIKFDARYGDKTLAKRIQAALKDE